MTLPNDFFTIQSMMTLTGATGATIVIANGCQKAFNFNPKWFALAIAVGISLFGVFASNGAGSDYFIGLVNGFLIFCTSAGASTIVGTPSPQESQARGLSDMAGSQKSVNKREFLTRWF
jgi:hypothetical protein